MEAVAKLLAGEEDPPPGFLQKLESLGKQLAVLQSAKRPFRSEMREQLLGLQQVLGEGHRKLFDDATLAYLVATGGPDLTQHYQNLSLSLPIVAKRAGEAAAHVPSRKGRGRAHPSDTVPTATTFCALIIVKAWTLLRDKPPASSNRRAQEAAETFWQIASGEQQESFIDQRRWRRSFAAVKKLNAWAHEFVRGQLEWLEVDPGMRSEELHHLYARYPRFTFLPQRE